MFIPATNDRCGFHPNPSSAPKSEEQRFKHPGRISNRKGAEALVPKLCSFYYNSHRSARKLLGFNAMIRHCAHWLKSGYYAERPVHGIKKNDFDLLILILYF